MKPVFDYQSYREFILDYYRERKRCSSFTWRGFAALVGFASGSYLKLVCDGKTRLLEEGAKKTAIAMGLVGFEFDYFVLMVRCENAKTEREKRKCFEELQSLRAASNVRLLGNEYYAYYETWKHSVVREMAPLMPGATPSEVARACRLPLTATDVAESLHFLLGAGFLTRDENGDYHQTKRSLTTGDMNVVSVAIHSLIRKMGEFALDAFDVLPISERHFSGLTMGVTEESYKEVVKELAECRKRIVSIVSKDKKLEKVCRLNIQFFPLTEKMYEDSNKKCKGD